jgi:hypothetical protein
MARRICLEENLVISTRIEKEMYDRLTEIAMLESLNTGTHVTVQQMIRDALKFVYTDNERLRECFRRSRYGTNRRFNKNT